MKRALSSDGIICCQGECLWLHLNIICEMKSFCEQLFPVVNYAYCTIPTYPSGQIGFLLCGKNPVSCYMKLFAWFFIIYKSNTCLYCCQQSLVQQLYSKTLKTYKFYAKLNDYQTHYTLNLQQVIFQLIKQIFIDENFKMFYCHYYYLGFSFFKLLTV